MNLFATRNDWYHIPQELLLLLNKYPSPLMPLEDISLLSLELGYGSESPGDDGPLLDI